MTAEISHVFENTVAVHSFHFIGNKCYVATRNKIMVIDCYTMKQVDAFGLANLIPCSLTSSYDGTVLYFTHIDGASCLFLASRKRVELTGHTGNVHVITGDNEHAFTASLSLVMMWHAASGARLKTFSGNVGTVIGLSYFSKTGTLFASDHNLLVCWNVNTDPVSYMVIVTDFGFHRIRHRVVNDKYLFLQIRHESAGLLNIETFAGLNRLSFGCDLSFMTVLDQRLLVRVGATMRFSTIDINNDNVCVVYDHAEKHYDYACISADGRFLAHNPMVSTGFYIDRIPLKRTVFFKRGQVMIDLDNSIQRIFLYSMDGAILTEDHRLVYMITPDTEVCVKLQSQLQLSDNHTPPVLLTFLSSTDAQVWRDAICAIRQHLAHPRTEQHSLSNKQINDKYRFDCFQQVKHMQCNRGLFGLLVPVEVMNLIGYFTIDQDKIIY